jgi:hypothetical protein
VDADEAGDGDLDTPARDTDEDGVPDYLDLDSDDDSVDDNCPLVSNVGQEDEDEDGTGDACEPAETCNNGTDDDEDGLIDCEDGDCFAAAACDEPDDEPAEESLAGGGGLSCLCSSTHATRLSPKGSGTAAGLLMVVLGLWRSRKRAAGRAA